MSPGRISPELSAIGFKLVLLFFVIGQSYPALQGAESWFILSILLYLSVNLFFYLLKKDRLKPAVSFISILLIAASANELHPLMILLLPASIYDLGGLFIGKQETAAFFLLASSLFFVPEGHFSLYLFVSILTWMYFSMLDRFSSRVTGLKSEMERMRDDLERANTRLRENNEYLRQSEYTMKLEERNRLLQEVHDNIGHAMTGALIQSEAAKLLIHSYPEKAGVLLDNAIQISKAGIDSIRADLKRMKPPTEQMGVNRMKLFLDEFSSRHSVGTLFTYEGNMDVITAIHWKIIQENAKEALTNSLKYAQASRIKVHIQVLPTLIKAEVTDNGQGQMKVIKGLGIMGMEERAATVNGKVIVDGTRGFSVTTLIPYTA